MSIRQILKRNGNKIFLVNVPFLDSAGGDIIPLVMPPPEELVFLLADEEGDIRITEDGFERILE